jgi:tRNA threonylcarbamoyl adenosine modification protein YjeE
MMDFVVRSEAETIERAQKLAAILQPGDVVFLNGDLGAGKTFFARALIRAMCGKADLNVPSPTFTLLQTYECERGLIGHFDLYRIKEPEEVYELGWEDALSDGIVLVEWAERLNYLAPKDRLEISFEASLNNANRRAVSYTPHGKAWQERLKNSDL